MTRLLLINKGILPSHTLSVEGGIIVSRRVADRVSNIFDMLSGKMRTALKLQEEGEDPWGFQPWELPQE